MDELDKAKQLEQKQRDAAIAAQLGKDNGVGRQFCIDCEDEIPPARRAVYPSAKRCIDCQQEAEKHG